LSILTNQYLIPTIIKDFSTYLYVSSEIKIKNKNPLFTTRYSINEFSKLKLVLDDSDIKYQIINKTDLELI